MLILNDIISSFYYLSFKNREQNCSKTSIQRFIDEYQRKYSINNATYRLLCVALHAENFWYVLFFCVLRHRHARKTGKLIV